MQKEIFNSRRLGILYPDVAAEWDYEKNIGLNPSDVTYGSNKKVWWRCEKEHEWQAGIYARVKSGSGCPYCAGKLVIKGFNNLATVNPELAREWNIEKNNGITAEEVHSGSNKSYWWKCALGHEWQAVMLSRTRRGTDCPYCANKKVLKGFNDLATIEPKIAKQWHPTLNGTLTPDLVVSGSHKYAWWQCSEGHVWKAKIESHSKFKTGCPVCAGNVKKTDRYKFVDEKVLCK